jgi:hypothetical protein
MIQVYCPFWTATWSQKLAQLFLKLHKPYDELDVWNLCPHEAYKLLSISSSVVQARSSNGILGNPGAESCVFQTSSNALGHDIRGF